MPEDTPGNDPETAARNPLSIAGRTVIVTGGAKGIGRVYSREFARAGAKIVVADIDDAANAETVAEIRDAGGEAVMATTDVADDRQAEAMARTAIDAFGRIDGLVNNASLMSVLERRDWHLIPTDEWDRVMEVNVRGVFACCKAVFPQMQAQNSGKIVNISSGRFWHGTPNRLHYSTSKAGVIGLTRSLAREVGRHFICVNAVTPGFTLSDTQVASSGDYAQNNAPPSDRCIPRHQYPEDLVGAVMFLLSAGANFISGQTVNVDGGQFMH
ncbi:MAG: SDR family oxidoreductase [Rhodospirillaceae bacterium]